MKFPKDCEVYIQLSADKYAGLWVNERQYKGGKKVRTAGRTPTGSTLHTALAVALINGLDAISITQIQQLRTDLGKAPWEKLKLKIVVADSTFADALRALMT